MAPPRVTVWDAVVRALHWALAALVAIDLIRDDGDYPHRLIGYAAVGVVLARLAWGALCRPPGRLSCLLPSIGRTKAYLRPLLRGAPPRSLGHNPLGVWMAWLIWLLVLLLGLTGWMSRLDAFWGDDFLTDLHAVLADILLVAVVVHLVGVGAMSWLWRENLPAAMITGKKRAESK
jgi:cytochrome b